jgi:hypothetical protein
MISLNSKTLNPFIYSHAAGARQANGLIIVGWVLGGTANFLANY